MEYSDESDWVPDEQEVRKSLAKRLRLQENLTEIQNYLKFLVLEHTLQDAQEILAKRVMVSQQYIEDLEQEGNK